MKTATAQPLQRCKIALREKDGTTSETLAPAHWLGQFIAVTAPAGTARDFAPCRGLWVITHRGCGLQAATLRCPKKRAVAIARQWDGRFGCIDPADARSWPWCQQWGELVRSINSVGTYGAPGPEDLTGTATAGVLAAEAGIPIDQAGGVLRIWWRGKFWPAPADAELDQWTFDSCAETPDGRTVEPDHPESWLRILRLV
jgi:hypothetical protein